MKAAGLSKQGSSLKWNVQQRVLKEHDMRRTSEALFQFTIKAVYDLLPTPQNKNLWFRTDQYNCHLCSGRGTLDHILTGCKVALTQGRYKWLHDKVLRELGYWVDEKRKSNNNMPWKKRSWIKFRKSGEKGKPVPAVPQDSFLRFSRDWKIQVDLPETPLSIPCHIAATLQRPDIILTSEALKQLIIIELTVPTEDRVEISSELKKSKYEGDVAIAAEKKGWKTIIWTVEVGCRGFPAHSLVKMLKELGYQGRQKKEILRKLGTLAEEASMQIWKSSHFKSWGEKA